jgi:GTP-binding protein
MLIDDVTIQIKAGNGGKGMVAFNKNLGSLGPSGGSGANGGNVYFEGVADLNALRQFRMSKVFNAGNGENGDIQFRDGHTGEDIILKIPIGTVIHNLDNSKDIEIVGVGERALVAKGGRGGKGNFLFRSSRDTSPTRFQPGLPGEGFKVRLEMKLIADIGFIGLPNIGKSSLLNELTEANSKVANYQFTTLEPNLGAYYELILADIPGLIEGASTGKGLGIKFLRHVERTKILFHFISAESERPDKDYRIIRSELRKYNPKLVRKPQYVFMTKTDLVKPDELRKRMGILEKKGLRVTPISIYDWDSIEKVKQILNLIKDKKLGIKQSS